MVLKNPIVKKLVQFRIFLMYLIMEFLFKFYLLNIYNTSFHKDTWVVLSRIKDKLLTL